MNWNALMKGSARAKLRRVSDEFREWQPGYYGKGLLDHSGQFHLWKTNADGAPHHMDYTVNHLLDNMSQSMYDEDPEGFYDWAAPSDYYHSPVNIAPDGSYTSAHGINFHGEPDGDEENFQKLHPTLRYEPDYEKWQDNWETGPGYGHAQNFR